MNAVKGEIPLDERDAHRIETMAGQNEADQVAESVSARILVVMPPLERPMAWL